MTSPTALSNPRIPGQRTSGAMVIEHDAHESRAFVEVTSSHRAGSIKLHDGVLRIGRAHDNDMVIDDAYVSRHHAEIRVSNGKVTFVDLGASNGSFLDGRAVRDVSVREEALLMLGRRVTLRVEVFEEEAPRPRGASELVGSSAAMDRLRTSIHRAAATNLTVLIEGEPGTGKDGVVRALHAGSPRHQGPLVMFDCRNIAPDRVAAALFGHVRGAFADTAGASEGAFRRAHNGTLYIDGICELPMEVQGALLRALDTREIRPVGGGSFIPVNVRVIASTPRSLEHQVSVGHFRKELLFRLAVARVRVPALRHRSEDIATLAEYFARHQGVSVDPAVTDALTHRSYRENVRELRGLVESAALRVGPGATITDIDPPCVDPSDRAAKSAFVVPRTQAPNQARPALASIATIGQRVPASRASMDFHSAKQIAVDAFEREYLAQLLEDCTYNLSEASRRAGVDRGHLRELCRKHDMDPARLRSERAASRAS